MPVLPYFLALLLAATTSASTSPVLLRDRFDRPEGLVTNSYAYWNAAKPAHRSRLWQVTSGSLFVRNGHAWTGVPDDRRPDRASSQATGSSVFRAVTRRTDLRDVQVSFRLFNAGLRPSTRVPAAGWNGVHLLLRYQSEYAMYAISINRGDDTAVIKKKVRGGPSNDGTYQTLATARYPVPYGRWQQVVARAVNTSKRSVSITLKVDGRVLLQVADTGAGRPAHTTPGRIGIRGDRCEFLLDDLVVTRVS